MERQSGGDGIYCYYNFKCSQEFLGIAAFNNIISNVGYVLLGMCYLGIVRFLDDSHPPVIDDEESGLLAHRPEDAERIPLCQNEESFTKGLHKDHSLYYCLGWTLFLEGVFSGLYHVCPSRIDFQFDTTFMIIGSVLLFIAIYQKRQPTIIAGPFRVYSLLGGIILLNVVSLVFDRQGSGSIIFWVIVMIVLAWVSLIGSLYLYHFERVSFGRKSLKRAWFHIRHPSRPRDLLRLAAIIFANCVNFSLTIVTAMKGYTDLATQDFPSFILALIVLDDFIYLIYYMIMKYRRGERVQIRAWIFLVSAIAFWGVASYYYDIAITNKFLTPAESKALNRPCVLFEYFDDHDIWHFLSSVGLFFLFLFLRFLDTDLDNYEREKITVF
eukprot:TRINITY_DN3989_c0_g1_i1.p1 TRINITY_DN3989_c0_g1~~TRINITY_DN3989_c0_g1_i1.p1  ORF type:complete len:383 (+),score=72.15 TRINITY_DN3989_c0_g1_i1:324-1472(+)